LDLSDRIVKLHECYSERNENSTHRVCTVIVRIGSKLTRIKTSRENPLNTFSSKTTSLDLRKMCATEGA